MSTERNPSPAPRIRQNRMHPIRWIPPEATSVLDVGCNVGELLAYCAEIYPAMRLAGVEVNPRALAEARRRLPGAVLHAAGAERLPFPDATFDCVTCIEVLEHVPAGLRAQALTEIRRVVRPGGRLVLRVPHAGLFACLDSNNLRFRLPGLYRALLGQGRRDEGYATGADEVVWHHHFTRGELHDLLGDGWTVEASRAGGLLLAPLSDLARWGFHRAQRTDNAIYRALQWISDVDLGRDYGRASFDILLVLRRVDVERP